MYNYPMTSHFNVESDADRYARGDKLLYYGLLLLGALGLAGGAAGAVTLVNWEKIMGVLGTN